MAQKQIKKATNVAKPPTTKTNFSLSHKAIGYLTVAGLFKNQTQSEIVEHLITTHLGKYVPMCGEREFIAFPTKSESAIQVSQVESPIKELA